MSPVLSFRRARGGAPVRRRGCAEDARLRESDLLLVGWMGEQYAARMDQLQALAGASGRTVQRTVARLRDAGLVSTRRILVGQPAWVLPTAAGLRVCSLPYRVWRPKVGQLAHVAAMNDVRLHIQGRSPDTVWIPERQLAMESGDRGKHLPDGVAITQGRRVAIEVELTVKSHRRVQAILDDLTGRFDGILYYCAPAPHRQLTGLVESGRWRKLGVRELPARAEQSAS